MLVTLDFGTQVDMLNKGELAEALAEDARLRALVTGVKTVEQWHTANSQIPASQTVYTTSPGPPYSPASGYVWAVMNIGFELAVSSNVRIYKGAPAGIATGSVTPTGSGRLVGLAQPGGAALAVSFSKGQLMMRTADQLTFAAVTAGAFILSAFIVSIEIPAERVGELLL